MLRIDLDFVEPFDDDMPTDKERKIKDLDKELEKEEAMDPNLEAATYGPDVDDDIDYA